MTASCAACGLAGLPAGARFCARCGARLGAGSAAGGRPAPWVLLLFWLGTGALLVLALVYAALLASPDIAGTASAGADPGQVRVGATVVALCAVSLFLAQLAAAVGLTTGRAWARLLATLVCVTWCLTCLGLPLGLLALNSIWRRSPAPALPGAA